MLKTDSKANLKTNLKIDSITNLKTDSKITSKTKNKFENIQKKFENYFYFPEKDFLKKQIFRKNWSLSFFIVYMGHVWFMIFWFFSLGVPVAYDSWANDLCAHDSQAYDLALMILNQIGDFVYNLICWRNNHHSSSKQDRNKSSKRFLQWKGITDLGTDLRTYGWMDEIFSKDLRRHQKHLGFNLGWVKPWITVQRKKQKQNKTKKNQKKKIYIATLLLQLMISI